MDQHHIPAKITTEQQNRKVRLEKKVKNKREREMRYLELSRKITL